MDELASARAFLRSFGSKHLPSILRAAKADGLTLPGIERLTRGMWAALIKVGWRPPDQQLPLALGFSDQDGREGHGRSGFHR